VILGVVMELIIKADISEDKAINIFTEGFALLTQEERNKTTKALILQSKKGIYINFITPP
jgi:hypothetical protein